MKNESLSTSMAKLVMAVSLIVGIGAVMGALGYFGTIEKSEVVINDGIEKEEIEDEEMTQDKTRCPDNWEEYNHDIIGIKFCYPEEWGEPSTSPIKNLTRLPNMKEEFKTQNIYYANQLDIVFEKNSQMRISLFNDQFSGKSQREINEPYVYYESGATEDVANLKINGDICDYKIGYDYKYNAEMKANTLKTIYSNCSDGIKAVLTQDKENFDFGDYGILYTYDLKLLSFKKLANNYFDNALISRKVDRANQIHEELATLDEFFNKKKTTNVEKGIPIKNMKQFEQELKEFQEFIDSITAYDPLLEVQDEFEKISGEDSNITIIREYYWLLSDNKIEEAYEMRSDKTGLAYETFQDWYKDIYRAKPYDFKSMNSNEYEFYVEYQDHNELKTKFKVAMSVNENKIKTLFSDEILTDEISFGEYFAYAIKRGDKNYMILEKNDEEIIIDEGEADYNSKYSNIGNVKLFYGPKFSSNGNYLTYSMAGWEWRNSYVYDINNKKRVYEFMTDGSQGFDFIIDENYFYVCSSPGMGSDRAGVVYKVPDFKNKHYDIFDDPKNSDYMNIYCEYDDGNKVVSYTLIDEDGNEKELEFPVIEDIN